MKIIARFVAAAFLGLGTLAWADGPQCEVAKPTYSIECWIIGTDLEGHELVITAPKIVVHENQAGSVRDVSQIPRPGNTPAVEWLEEGTSIEAKIFCADDGQRFLDAKIQLTGGASTLQEPPPAVALLTRFVPGWIWKPTLEKTDGIRLISTGVRVVEPIKFGEKTTVPLAAPGFLRDRDLAGAKPTKHRVELRVSETAPSDRTCARLTKPSGDLILGGVTPRIIIQGEEEEKLGIEMP